jgi:Na+-transporting methylmalonyl-CoA/oxaloacetate decarboxylase gamma subunit
MKKEMSQDEQLNEGFEKNAIVLLGVGVLFIFIIWLVWAFSTIALSILVSAPSREANVVLGNAGTFGDLFGGINALFTGFGIVFLAFTIWQQSRLIQQQQYSIKQMEKDLHNQKEASQREQALQSILRIHAVLQDQSTRSAREIVLSGQGQPKSPTDLTYVLIKENAIQLQELSLYSRPSDTGIENQQRAGVTERHLLRFSPEEQLMLRWYRAAELVLHSYDFLGLLIAAEHFQKLDIEAIKQTWGDSIKRCHGKLKDYLGTPFRPKDVEIDENLLTLLDEISTGVRSRTAVLGAIVAEKQLHGLPYDNFCNLLRIVS